MSQAFTKAYKTYKSHVYEKKKKKEAAEADVKMAHINSDSDKINVKDNQIHDITHMMDSEFVECMKVEHKNQHELDYLET